MESCFEIIDFSILVGSIENLYKNASKFVDKVTEFLEEKIAPEKKIEFPIIEKLERQHFNSDIPIENCPSIESFYKQYFLMEKPALITNSINHWPALNKWRDISYLYKTAGNRLVPIEIGGNYTSEEWSQELLQLKKFLICQFSNEENHEIQYLAQHELFDQIPDLAKDFTIPDYCTLGSKTDVDIKAWLGPTGTVSPLHQDPKHNILCQVFGRKRIILAAPIDTENLYTFEGRFLNNTSSVDVENIDFEKFPLVKNVRFFTLTLQEGECLYIPVKWWHYVRSMTRSFSVSFWWE